MSIFGVALRGFGKALIKKSKNTAKKKFDAKRSTFKAASEKNKLNQSQIEDYLRLIKLKDEMIKVVKPKWYENKWIWFGLGVVATAGSVKLAGEIVD